MNIFWTPGSALSFRLLHCFHRIVSLLFSMNYLFILMNLGFNKHVKVTQHIFKGKFLLCLKWGKCGIFRHKINFFLNFSLNLFIRYFWIVSDDWNWKVVESVCFVFLRKIYIMPKMGQGSIFVVWKGTWPPYFILPIKPSLLSLEKVPSQQELDHPAPGTLNRNS